MISWHNFQVALTHGKHDTHGTKRIAKKSRVTCNKKEFLNLVQNALMAKARDLILQHTHIADYATLIQYTYDM